jgi:hypothetical protein
MSSMREYEGKGLSSKPWKRVKTSAAVGNCVRSERHPVENTTDAGRSTNAAHTSVTKPNPDHIRKQPTQTKARGKAIAR